MEDFFKFCGLLNFTLPDFLLVGMYLKMRFVSNILWTKISKNSHCEQSPQLNDGNAVHLSRYLEINRFIGMT